VSEGIGVTYRRRAGEVCSLGREVERRARAQTARVAAVGEALRARLTPLVPLRSRSPRPAPEPYSGRGGMARLLLLPGLLGTVASIAIFVGASLPSSPFTLKIPGAWFFGIAPPPLVQGLTAPPGQALFLGVVAVYGGMLLMFRAWYDLARIAQRHPGLPVRFFVPIFVAWVVPMLIVAPLFSRDVYSYAAQAEMMSRGINPYRYGPGVLGANAFVTPVDPLWRNVTSPYGPVFLALSSAIVSLSNHNELWTVVWLRVVELVGVGMIGFAIPPLARSYGYDGSTAFIFAVLNPLILLHLVAGAHNDALMLGLLVVGLLASRRGRPVLGIVLCALAAAVKVPAALGIVYIGWEWLGDGVDWKERIRPLVAAGLIGGATLAAASELAGLGWGWIRGLGNPETVVSYLDPSTALGKLAGVLAGLVGLGGHGAVLLEGTRDLGLLLAAIVGIVLLFRSTTATSARAIALTFLAVVAFGPTLEPWYVAWGVVMLAVVAEGRRRTLLIVCSIVASFIGLPGGNVFIHEVEIANPFLLGGAVALLVAVVALLVITRPSRSDDSEPGSGEGLQPVEEREAELFGGRSVARL